MSLLNFSSGPKTGGRIGSGQKVKRSGRRIQKPATEK